MSRHGLEVGDEAHVFVDGAVYEAGLPERLDAVRHVSPDAHVGPEAGVVVGHAGRRVHADAEAAGDDVVPPQEDPVPVDVTRYGHAPPAPADDEVVLDAVAPPHAAPPADGPDEGVRPLAHGRVGLGPRRVETAAEDAEGEAQEDVGGLLDGTRGSHEPLAVVVLLRATSWTNRRP